MLPSKPSAPIVGGKLPTAPISYRVHEAIYPELKALLSDLKASGAGLDHLVMRFVGNHDGFEVQVGTRLGDHFQIAGKVGRAWSGATEWAVMGELRF